MRILIAALALATTGCYEPSVADCQYSCTADDTCVDGMSCQAGYCRPVGATGACQAGSNNTTDARMDGMPDGPPGCPAAPSGCTAGMTFSIGATGCGVVCLNQVTWIQANATCTADWAFAALHPNSELSAVPTLSIAPWVGAQRQATNWQWVDGVVVDTTAWEGGTAPVGGCAQINANKKLINDPNCGATHEFICEHI